MPTAEVIDAVTAIYVTDLATSLPVKYDLQAAGYTVASSPLIDPAKGRYALDVVDQSGNPAQITVAGVLVVGTGIPYLMNLAPASDHYGCYIRFNKPSKSGLYTCTATFTQTGGLNAQSYSWTIFVP